MDKLILGLLMASRLTVYEIRTIIRKNFKDICSDSLGAIQFAIKKLLAAEMITFSEYVEKSVNKKKYSITDKGRAELLSWLETPANISGGTNMELGKLLFMGMVPAEKRAHLMDEVIAIFEKDLAYLLAVKSVIGEVNDASEKQWEEYFKSDSEYLAFARENAQSMSFFQRMTLQYGIDLTKYNIEWFKNLKELDKENIK
ncbi:MAG: PadR family transcriptional regulator [Oscillospiraceae bacterium]|nr:PadR family transcriptional regulator [Oscillospiraceae bacterium]